MNPIDRDFSSLSEDERVRFAELAVFPNDGPIPEAAVLALWSRKGGLSAHDARALLAKLKDRSLIALDRVGDVSLNDISFTFANRQAEKLIGDKQAQHARLVEAYAERCPNGWADGPNDGYFFTHLFHHLNEAGRGDERPALLLNLSFLEAKAETGHVFDLAMDFTRTLDSLPANHPARRRLRLISRALRRDIDFIARHPSTLFQCLWNQCWWHDCPKAAGHYIPPANGWPPQGAPWEQPEADRLSTLLESWRAEKVLAAPGFVWLRSLRPPPFPLDGAGVLCLHGHEEGVVSAAFNHDETRIVTASRDKTARVWDAQSGEQLASLQGHEGRGHAAAFNHDGTRIITASRNETARVWDVQSGECLQVIAGSRDAAAIAASLEAPGKLPWLARPRDQDNEIVIEPTTGGAAVAWFPTALQNIATHPSGREWAGSTDEHLALIRLEGEPAAGNEGKGRDT